MMEVADFIIVLGGVVIMLILAYLLEQKTIESKAQKMADKLYRTRSKALEKEFEKERRKLYEGLEKEER